MKTSFRQDSWNTEDPSFKIIFNLIFLKLCCNSIYSQVWGPDTSVGDIFDAVETAIHDADLVPQVPIRISGLIVDFVFYQVESPLAHLEL